MATSPFSPSHVSPCVPYLGMAVTSRPLARPGGGSDAVVNACWAKHLAKLDARAALAGSIWV